jgi:hypothetical protein
VVARDATWQQVWDRLQRHGVLKVDPELVQHYHPVGRTNQD